MRATYGINSRWVFETAMAVGSLELEKNEYRDTIRKQDVLPINGQADVQPEMLRWGKNERMTSYAMK